MNAADQDLVRAYRLFFSSPPGDAVLRDLMKFCNFRKDVSNEIDEGKRRVFLRILTFSQCSDEQIMALFAGRDVMKPGDDDE